MKLIKNLFCVLIISIAFNACTPTSLDEGPPEEINPVATGDEYEMPDQNGKD